MSRRKSSRVDVYDFWHVEFRSEQNGEVIASCPFCLEKNSTRPNLPRFYINKDTGAFSCKVCGKEGGYRDFLAWKFEQLQEHTTEQQLRRFMLDTGIPIPAYRQKIAAIGNRYVIPAYDTEERVTDLRIYQKGKKEQSTKAIASAGLVGLREIATKQKIFICESFRDKLALDWLIWRNKLDIDYAVVGCPGANIFKKEWGPLFTGKDVIICFDHDSSGYGTIDPLTDKVTGSRKVAELVKPFAKSLQYVTWPTSYQQGYDVRDFIRQNKANPKAAWKKLESFTGKKHKDDAVSLALNGDPSNNIPIEELIKKCGEVYKVTPDFLNSMYLTTALIFANKIPGKDKPWLFLIGPPASGKTLALEQFEDASNHVIWESRLTRQALISGFNLGTNQRDPSILARVNGKLLALKDATELFALNRKERDEVFSLLRGAFDGRASYPFGNGVRRYNSIFTCIFGVTNAIEAYNTASLGERFLRYKYEDYLDEDELMDIASTARLFGLSKAQEVKEIAEKFLNNVYDFSPATLRKLQPDWFRQELKVLAKLVALLRTDIVRHETGIRMGEVVYEPVTEKPTRIFNQLECLAMSLAIIQEKDQIDRQIYELIKRIGKDTIPDYTYKIVRALSGEKYLERNELRNRTRITDIDFYLKDLQILGVLEKNERRFSLCKKVLDLWTSLT